MLVTATTIRKKKRGDRYLQVQGTACDLYLVGDSEGQTETSGSSLSGVAANYQVERMKGIVSKVNSWDFRRGLCGFTSNVLEVVSKVPVECRDEQVVEMEVIERMDEIAKKLMV